MALLGYMTELRLKLWRTELYSLTPLYLITAQLAQTQMEELTLTLII